jgi:hypothetical protein
MNDIQKVSDSILSDISLLSDISSLDGGTLSEIALRLSVNKVYVGQAVAGLEYNLSQHALSRKLIWAKMFKSKREEEERPTVKDAELFADGSTYTSFKEELEMERDVSTLKNLRRDVSDCITTIQTRIGQLKSEMIEANSN